jgi:NAD-dependent dihydropyrimidine dehydrogenase PreA subunit
MQQRYITVCVCASREIIDKDKVAALAARLKAGGYAVVLEPDLCGKIQNGAPEALRAASGTVLACYPRAVRSLFDTLGATPEKIIDIRNGSAETVSEELGLAPLEANGDAAAVFAREIAAMPRQEGADPWFPVIDKQRCSECEKCRDFCLFGVYAVENGRVAVRQPGNCKNNCPACARLCPSEAIIFPKYERSPVNGGLENEEHATALDTNAIYDEALRERLAARRGGAPLFKYKGK